MAAPVESFHWRVRFRVDGPTSEALGDRLTDLDAVAVTFENAGPESFYEAAYPQDPDWSKVDVTGLFPARIDAGAIVRRVESWYGQSLPFEVSKLPNRDWEKSWFAGFRPFQVGRYLWVCPSWSVPPSSEAVNVIIDPGLAFGTGTHPTTALCLDWLDRHPPRAKRVIDYGCGSGILAIASLLLGASHAWGVDVDPRAIEASRGNARRNGVAGRLAVCAPSEMPDVAADLVMANILAGVLVELSDRLSSLLREGGTLLLTGILPEQEQQVLRAFPSRWSFERAHREGWLMLVGYKG